MDRHNSTSPSPSRRLSSFGNALSALGARISRTLSHDETTLTGDPAHDSDAFSVSTVGSAAKDRSQSRGRDVYQSSGRGGAGNMRQTTSTSRDAPRNTEHIIRGREPIPAAMKTFSTGRGGAGNIRSPSRDPTSIPVTVAEEEQDEIIRAHIAAQQEGGLHSSGRGGAGNISRSRSRGPGVLSPSNQHSPPALQHGHATSTGRGGAGNIVSELSPGADAQIHGGAPSPRPHAHAHSVGRGGAGNVVSEADWEGRGREHEPGFGTGLRGRSHSHHPHPEPIPEDAPPPEHAEYESTGRGGAGNMHPIHREGS
ncbi:hypothetical protein DXG03_003355 [Asterophora parasitica]|uniref:Uncharacterized protein n=1 Tax=Asterophora parasitica TaxID=117018 RepID=A0A9P7KAM5_9AGAR|nr:hypothetical protein DXG03_003355 [Asterophora parasitica]